MPHVTFPIGASGPVLDLGIGVSEPRAKALHAAKQPVPKAVRIRALIDTGASGTCVDPGCLSSLALTPIGQASIHTPTTGNTPHSCNQYDVSITLFHPGLMMTLPVVAVIESNLSIQGIQALLGRDVLSNCLFVYDGGAGTFALAF